MTSSLSADLSIGDYQNAWQQLVFPADYQNPKPEKNYNLVVIGAGSAGLITSIAAAGLGAKVALVERHAMGGDCLNYGCVPSKALLAAAHQYQDKEGGFEQAFTWLKKVRAEIAEHDSVERYSGAGVDVFLGEAEFTENGQVEVKNESGNIQLSGSRYVITSGSRAAVPPIKGLDEVAYLTNENLFDLDKQPASMLIVGAGAIGCEMAEAFALLGTQVKLVEMADQILPVEDVDAADCLQKNLQQLGVTVLTGLRIEQVQAGESGFEVRAADQQGEQTLHTDALLIATGRSASTDGLHLDRVGVTTDRNGVKVDDKLRTSNPKIFAAGDICSSKRLTHNADTQARIVIGNALFLPTGKYSTWSIPHCTYTTPEVARLGYSRKEAEEAKLEYDSWRVNWSDMDRAKTEGDTDGYVEVLTERGKDKIIGATIVGAHAGDLLAPLIIMHANNLGLSAAGKAVLPYPSRGEYLKRLADQYNKQRLTPLVAKLFKHWLAWRR